MRLQLLPLYFFLLFLPISVIGQETLSGTAPKIISSSEFKMPETAENVGIDGTLVVAISLDKTGRVKSAEIIAGPAWPCGTNPKKEIDELKKAVRDNVMITRFSPAIMKGKPQSSDLRIKFAVGVAYKLLLEKRETEEGIRNGTIKQVNGGVLNGRATSLPNPDYPGEAKLVQASGSVPVEVLIDEQGKVARAGVTGGHSTLQTAARNAACSAKFAPTMLYGQPVKVSGFISYNFTP